MRIVVIGLLGYCLAFLVLVVAEQKISRNELLNAGSDKNSIPVIDLRPWTTAQLSNSEEERIRVAKAVGRACEDIGFFVIRHHGVNETRLTQAWEAVRSFFDLPLPQKLEHQTNNEAEYPYGYERSERLTLGKERDRAEKQAELSEKDLPPPDLKETFSIGPNSPKSGMPSRRYPDLPGMKEALDDCYAELEKLALILLRIFAVALDLPEHWFDDKMNRHLCALRALNYPPLSANNTELPQVVRAGAHTDYGALTILKTGGPGLQAKKDNNQSNWIDVPHLEDALIINLGDLMQRWTNDRWVSTLHRVALPPGDGPYQRRQSMAFFVNINGDAVVTALPTCVDADHPVKYGPIVAREHLMAKHLASMGKKSNEFSGYDEL